MIVHIDKLIRHLKTQISTAEQMKSEFCYLTKRETEACLELAEAQDIIQEMVENAVRCNDCRYWKDEWSRNRQPGWLPCMAVKTRPDFYCADGKRKNY